jgi:hypothetical protein
MTPLSPSERLAQMAEQRVSIGRIGVCQQRPCWHCEEAEALRAGAAALRQQEALRAYVQHKPECVMGCSREVALYRAGTGKEPVCTCGLSDLLGEQWSVKTPHETKPT